MSDWSIWLLIWWAGWFAILLSWYEHNKKERLHIRTCIFMFLLAGLAPFVGVISLIIKGTKKDN